MLVSYARGRDTVPAATPPATMDLVADGTLLGTTGCNTFSGTWSGTAGGDLSLTIGPVTRVACTDPELSAQEQAVLTGLPGVTRARLSGDELELLTGDGSVLFTYAGGPEGVEGSWRVTGVNDGRGAVVGTDATDALEIRFAPDGTVSGNTGCNSFSGPYEISGERIAIGELASTMIGCEAEKAALEQELLAALRAAATWERSGRTVTLRDASGAAQVVLVPAP